MGAQADGLAERIRNALDGARPPTAGFRSKGALRDYIIDVARTYGFNLFLSTRSGYEELTVRTRIKYHRKYGNPPAARILVIPDCLVTNLRSIYRHWPELGEFFLRAALWHESQHLRQDPTACADFRELEEEANRLMIEKMGVLGLVVCVWYFTLFRRPGVRDWVWGRKQRVALPEARKRIVDRLDRTYSGVVPPEKYDDIVAEVLQVEAVYREYAEGRRR